MVSSILNYGNVFRPQNKVVQILITIYMIYGKIPDSIPPSDRRWPNVGTSVGPTLAADVGPTAF